jgi:hypothetical protein
MDYNDSERRQIAAAKEARERINSGQHFHDWLAVGEGLVAIRNAAMRAAGVPSPQGPHYRKAWKIEIAAHTWADFDSGTRAHAMWLADNIAAVSRWREIEIGQNQREQFNHPSVVKRRFEATHSTDRDKTEAKAKLSPLAEAKEKIEILEREKIELARKAQRTDDFNAYFDWFSDSAETIASILMGGHFPKTKVQKVAAIIFHNSQEARRKAKPKLLPAPAPEVLA